MGESEEELKRQFEQLQLQQQQKLQRRKEIKQKQKEEDNQVTASRNSTDFGVSDNLDLKTEDPLPKSSSYLTEELVDHLNEQLKELKDENSRLFKLLSERDYEIRQLKRKVEEDKIALSGSSSLTSDSAATKIVELSKKVRELNAALETKRTEAKQLFGRCRHLENELAKSSNIVSPRLNSVNTVDDVLQSSTAENESELKLLKDKLRLAEQKNAEYRNQVQAIKMELKMAHKVIGNEVGEGVNIHDLINANSGWRGRAQQILGLQKKIGELKQQLDQQQMTSRSGESVSTGNDLETEFMGSSQSRGADMKHREVLRKLEKEKKDQLERAAAELKALEADYETLRQKMEASKARNKVLASENKSFRTEMQKLVDKGLHDDELISALIAQQANMKTMLEQLTSAQRENQHREHERITAIAAQSQQESNIIQQLKAIVSDKEARVKQLELELTQLQKMKVEESQRASVGQLFDQSATEVKGDVADDQTNFASMETEMQQNLADLSSPVHGERDDRKTSTDRPLSVRSISQSSNKPASGKNRLPSAKIPLNDDRSPSTRSPSRNGSHTPSNDGRLPSRRASSRAGSAVSINHKERTEKLIEIEAQCQEYKSLAQAAQVERDRLMELLQLTQKRLDEANEQSLSYQNEMKVQKKNAVQLEKQIGKLKLEKTMAKSSAGVQKRGEKTNMGSSLSLNSNADSHGANNSTINELETSLILQRDENEALKAALESTLKAKEEDLKLYNEMIEQTKLVFLEGLRQFKNKTN